MSNLLGVAGFVLVLEIVLLLAWAGASVAMLRRWGLFRAEGVLGPERVGPDEHPAILPVILLVAFATGTLAAQAAVSAWDIPEDWHDYVATIVLSAVGIAVSVAGLTWFREAGIRRIGLTFRQLPSGLAVAVAAVLAVLPLVYLVGLVSQAIARAMDSGPEPHRLLQSMGEASELSVVWILAAMAVLIAPLFEELLFRGLMQTFLMRLLTGPIEAELPVARRAVGRWQAILITSLLFSAVHIEPAFLAPLFVLSVGLGIAYERTGNLWVPMLMHALFNALQIVWFLVLPMPQTA